MSYEEFKACQEMKMATYHDEGHDLKVEARLRSPLTTRL